MRTSDLAADLRTTQGPLGFLDRLRRVIERVGDLMGDLAGWAYLLCALFITFDVISRRYFGFSSQGTTEISGYMLAFGITWGLAQALTHRTHIRVDVIVMRFPIRVRAYLHTLALAFLLVLSGLLARRAWDVVSESLLFNAKDTSALSIPLAVPQSLWAVGLSVFVVLVALMFLEALLLLASGRREAVDRMLVPRSLQEETGEALEAAGLAHGAEARDDAEAPTLRGAP